MTNISDLQADYKAAANFLGGLPLKAINVTALAPDSDKPIKSHSFQRNAAGIAGCEKFLEKYGAEGRNLYFNCNDLSVVLSKSKRIAPDGTTKIVYKAGEAEVARVNMLFTDVDPPDGTTQADLPAARAALLARAKAYQPAPIIIIGSGNGLGLFWTLDKSIKATPANLLELKGYNKKLIDDLEGDPACVNLDHVMRIPYTINMPGARKRKLGRVPVMATLIDDDSSLNSCTIDQFTSAAVEAGSSAAVTSGNEYAGIGSPEIPTKVDLAKLPPDLQARIMSGAPIGERSDAAYHVACDLRRAGWSDGAIIHVLINPDYKISDHIFDNPQRSHEDQAARVIDRMNCDGVAAIKQEAAKAKADAKKRRKLARNIIDLLNKTVANGCTELEAAKAAAHAFSLRDKYDITDEELIAAKAEKTGQAGHAGATSSTADTADIHQPITPNATWETLLKDYVYIGQQGQFVRRADGEMWNVDKFEKQFHSVRYFIHSADPRQKTPTSITSEIFDLGPNGMATFDTFCFMPGKEERYKNAFNQWRKSPIEPKEDPEALKPWNEHLAYLFPRRARAQTIARLVRLGPTASGAAP